MKTTCPFHLYSRDFFTTDRAFLQPYSTLCTGYLADLYPIEGFKASSSFLSPTTAAPKTMCCKGMIWGLKRWDMFSKTCMELVVS